MSGRVEISAAFVVYLPLCFCETRSYYLPSMNNGRTVGATIVVLSFLLASVADGQQVRFFPVNKDIVEAHLKDAPSKNEDRKVRLEELFQDAGCKDENLANQKVNGSRLPNVICTLSGPSESVIIVGAHFDNQGAGSGIVDNWSGASLLPHLYQSLSKERRHHVFRFIGFTDEEKGLVGSRFYAERLKKEEITNVKAMINLDTLGLGPAELWLNRGDKALANLFFGVAGALELPRIAMNVEQVGSTDSESFRQLKIPSLTVHSITQRTLPILHSPADKLSAINLDDYYQSYRLLTAYLIVLDQQIP